MVKKREETPVGEERRPAEQEMAIVPTRGHSMAEMPDVRAMSVLARCQTSLDIRSHRGRALLIAARSAADTSFDANGFAQLLATDWAVFPDSAPDEETGELKHFVRTVLFDAKGMTFRTTSEHAPSRLADMLTLYTEKEWRAGLPVVIQQRRSSKTGRTYHDIRVDPNYDGSGNGRLAT